MGLFYLFFVSSCRSLKVLQPHTSSQEEKLGDMDDGLVKAVALNLTLYFEDVLADAGIWRSFTDRMHELYGKYLPFYQIDEAEYLRDEPNLPDVMFIIWNTLHVFLATLYIRIGKRLWAFGLK